MRLHNLVLALGVFQTNLAYRMAGFVISWWVLQTTGSSFATGTSFALSVLPNILFGFIGGNVADSKWVKLSLVIPNVISAISLGFMGMVLSASTPPSYLWSYGWSFFIGTLATLERPSMLKLSGMGEERRMVESMSNITLASQSAALLGPVLVGLMLSWMSISEVIFLSAILCFFGSIAKWYATRRVEIISSSVDSSAVRSFIFSFRHNPILRWIILFAGINFFLVPIAMFIPLMVQSWFGNAPHALAMLEIGIGAGSILGSILPRFLKTRDVEKSIFWAMLIASASYAFLSIPLSLVMSAMILFVLSAACMSVSTNVTVVFQKKISQDMKGRAFAWLSSYGAVFGPLGFFVFGKWVDHFSLTASIITASAGLGLLILVGQLIAFRVRI